MKWDVYYNHAFYYDVIVAHTEEQAKEIAIKKLKADMPNMNFPTRVETIIGGETHELQTVYSYADFIEEICEHEEDEEDE